MALPAVAHAPLTPEHHSSDDATHHVRESSSNRVASLRTGPMSSRLSATDTGLPQRTSRHRRTHKGTHDDSSGGSSVVSTGSASSWEDYDALQLDPAAIVEGAKGGGFDREVTLMNVGSNVRSPGPDVDNKCIQALLPPIHTDRPSYQRSESIPIRLEETDQKRRHLLTVDDPGLRDILRRGIERESQGVDVKRRSKFSDLVFTRQFTAFDRQNSTSAASLFHGFYTLFWLGTALLLMKVAANNFKTYGSIFGRNEIMTMMFHRDVALLGLTDGVMCASTYFCLLLQRTIVKGYVSWNRQGWIIQSVRMSTFTYIDSSAGNCLLMRYFDPSEVWQAFYLGVIIGWTIHRSWPWTHTLFIVLHCLVMLMKQHSYAAFNGYLSEIDKRRKALEKKLEQLKDIEPVAVSSATTPSASFATSYLDTQDSAHIHRRRRSVYSNGSFTSRKEESEISTVACAIEPGASLDVDQIQSFERLVRWEIDGLTEELNSKCSNGGNCYPLNLNLKNFADYICLPTVVYELEYPRQEHISWSYVAEKTAATFGVLAIMIVVSQAYIYPIVISALKMKEQGMSLQERVKDFPWILSDLLFPFMLEYLLAWYIIWECVLNVLAELTRFADRGFYADWWNSVSWDQFARDWNRPVHNFLLRHVYHSSISACHLSRTSATLVTFLLSACVHELVMWCIFKKLRGYLMAMQMLQLPLTMLSRTRLLKGRSVLGNLVFWIGIFTGPSFLCSLYLII
ncbi:MAG: acyl-CoA/sterol acyltransferase [Pleopsidium flavum]|nr:MAG: acyl-CoA/sterol acyltransferase [Pleopsidium flavum]